MGARRRVFWVLAGRRGQRSPILMCRQTKVSESFIWPPGKGQLKVLDPARGCNIGVYWLIGERMAMGMTFYLPVSPH